MFKLFILLIIGLVCALPTELYLLARLFFEPHGFWQELFLFGIGFWFLGGLQVILMVVFFIIMVMIITS